MNIYRHSVVLSKIGALRLNTYLLILFLMQTTVFSACSQNSESVSTHNTETPYPIQSSNNDPDAPNTYKGLKLRLTDNGAPGSVTPFEGSIGVVCIGMSNSKQECDQLIAGVEHEWADQTNPQIKLINCAVGGHAIEKWDNPKYDSVLWGACENKIKAKGLTKKNIKVILHIAADQFTKGPDKNVLPAYPDPKSDYFNFIKNLTLFSKRVTNFFPSLQAVFTTSRSYGGFSKQANRGEPLSYEEGHALNKWLEDHKKVKGVWFGWGPYTWAPKCSSGIVNGAGICYDRQDFVGDGVHPSSQGRIKIAMLWQKKLSAYGWYRK